MADTDPHSRKILPLSVFPDPHFRFRIARVPDHGPSGDGQHSHSFDELVVIVDGHGKHHVGDEVYEIEDYAAKYFAIMRQKLMITAFQILIG